MTSLLQNISNSIWHAFNFLSGTNSNVVVKSKLKVLTANIGTILDLYGVEKGLDHFRSTISLSFRDFLFYLETEIFSNIPSNVTLKQCQSVEGKIEDVCWLVCQKYYFDQNDISFSSSTVYQLFRIFCFLSETILVDDASNNSYRVILNINEFNKLSSDLALLCGEECDENQSVQESDANIDFSMFLLLLDRQFGHKVASEALEESIKEIFTTLTQDVIKKGTLLKRGYLLPHLKEFCFVLQTTELNYFRSSSADAECCGNIPLSPHCTLDTGYAINNKDKSFRINGVGSTIELVALDYKSRLQWISAVQLAINHSGGTESYQRRQVARRRMQRNAIIEKLHEENLRRANQYLEIKATKEKLQQEIKAREAADKRNKELQMSLEQQTLEARELLDVRNKLETLLKEEIQAKQDEEIVRSLQARVLREEWERREELEKLQQKQHLMLQKEREKREVFEKQQKLMETNLKAAEKRLRALEEERQALDNELRVARDKITQSEATKQILERKLGLQ